MKTLPIEFRSDDFDFKQLAREGDVALFEKTKPWRKVPEYEVVIVQKRKATEVFGHATEAHEAMPSASQFGKMGWSFINLDLARQKFTEKVVAAQVR